jgi:carboxymethylenebutenolidase
MALVGAVGKIVKVAAVVSYGCSHPTEVTAVAPYLAHVAGRYRGSKTETGLKIHEYPDTLGIFVLPAHDTYVSSAAAVAHTRTLSFIKPLLGGPYFDLESIWDEHTLYEFGERSVEKTMVSCTAP